MTAERDLFFEQRNALEAEVKQKNARIARLETHVLKLEAQIRGTDDVEEKKHATVVNSSNCDCDRNQADESPKVRQKTTIETQAIVD